MLSKREQELQQNSDDVCYNVVALSNLSNLLAEQQTGCRSLVKHHKQDMPAQDEVLSPWAYREPRYQLTESET